MTAHGPWPAQPFVALSRVRNWMRLFCFVEGRKAKWLIASLCGILLLSGCEVRYQRCIEVPIEVEGGKSTKIEIAKDVVEVIEPGLKERISSRFPNVASQQLDTLSLSSKIEKTVGVTGLATKAFVEICLQDTEEAEAILEFCAYAVSTAIGSLSAAAQLMDAGELDDAIVRLKNFLKVDPDNPVGHFYVGVAYGRKGLHDEAIASFKKTLELKPDYASAHFELAEVYRKKDSLDEAKAEYEAALELKPDHPKTLVGLAEVHSKRGEFKLAEERLRKAIDMNPAYAYPKYKLGWLYHDYLRYDKATSILQELTEKNPENYYNHIFLADLYRHVGNYDAARTEAERGINISPDKEYSYRILGLILMDQEKHDDAIRWFKKAVEIDTNNAWTHAALGYGFSTTGQFNQAISEFQKAMELDLDRVRSMRLLGWVYLLKGEHGKAQEWYEKAIKVDPDDPEIYHGLSTLYIDTSNLKAAADAASKAKELSRKPYDMIYSSVMETYTRILSKKDYDPALKELLSLMKQGKYFNLKGEDFRVLERSTDRYTLGPKRKHTAQRVILLAKGEMEPSNF